MIHTSLLVILKAWQPKQADIKEKLRETMHHLAGEPGANTMLRPCKRPFEVFFEAKITTSECIYCDSTVFQVRKIRLLGLNAHGHIHGLVPTEAVYFSVKKRLYEFLVIKSVPCGMCTEPNDVVLMRKYEQASGVKCLLESPPSAMPGRVYRPVPVNAIFDGIAGIVSWTPSV